MYSSMTSSIWNDIMLCNSSLILATSEWMFHNKFTSLDNNGTKCPVNGLLQIMDWMIQVDKGAQFSCLLSKLALPTLVYHVWGERNVRIFKGYWISGQQLEAKVRTDIKASVSSWRGVKKSSSNLALCALWNLPVRVFDSV
ncbi:hypothetical protein RHSIM_Rhsim02G0079200 [Rhododendron simsii]|uniref:Uncharacterized protein n=1 Tax=Rhododendron simsii TaxID=118357 RepID=A0A834HEY0_RHOSS|nr:hypothetical protein RHSIM_Rhsim02G0079200 [Rhododendron simsii]